MNPDEPENPGRWPLDADDGLAAGRAADDELVPAEELADGFGAGRLAFETAGRALAEPFDLALREAFEDTVLRFFVDALRETAPRLAGDFARPLAADRFFAALRDVEAERDFDAELRAATFGFDELRRALAPRLVDFFAERRAEPDRPAEAFFDFEAARPRLAFALDELPERPEDLEEPRFLDTITTPFDVSALWERIDR